MVAHVARVRRPGDRRSSAMRVVQVRDRVAGQGFAADDDLEAVVVRRIVAAGDRHAGAGAQVVGAEVHHRRRRQADVDDVAAGLAQAVRSGLRSCSGPDRRPSRPTTMSSRPCCCISEPIDWPSSSAMPASRRLADHAADVIGAEDAAVDHRPPVVGGLLLLATGFGATGAGASMSGAQVCQGLRILVFGGSRHGTPRPRVSAG